MSRPPRRFQQAARGLEARALRDGAAPSTLQRSLRRCWPSILLAGVLPLGVFSYAGGRKIRSALRVVNVSSQPLSGCNDSPAAVVRESLLPRRRTASGPGHLFRQWSRDSAPVHGFRSEPIATARSSPAACAAGRSSLLSDSGTPDATRGSVRRWRESRCTTVEGLARGRAGTLSGDSGRLSGRDHQEAMRPGSVATRLGA